MRSVVAVRRAHARDIVARAEVLRDALAEHNWATFLVLLFQETTLQVVVLCSAGLFIFLGASLFVCALVPLGAALLLRVAVTLAYHLDTDALLNELRREEFGLVAVAVAGPRPGAGALKVRVLLPEESRGMQGAGRVVGTVSVARHRTLQGAGWVRALCVRSEWRRGGVARTLLWAAKAQAQAPDCKLTALEGEVTHLQVAARALLEAEGWQARGAGERAVAGGALSLPVLRLGMQLSPPLMGPVLNDNTKESYEHKYSLPLPEYG